MPGPMAYARERLSYAKPAEVPRLALRAMWLPLRHRIWSRTELRVYCAYAERIRSLPNLRALRVDSSEDLDRYERTDFHGQMPKDEFLRTAQERLANGCHVYTLVENGRLIHYGWLQERQVEAKDPKVGITFYPPANSALTWDSYTHPAARDRGLFQSSLCQRLHEAVERTGAKRVYSYVFGTNPASWRVIQKIYEHEGTLVREIRLGRVRRYVVANVTPFYYRLA